MTGEDEGPSDAARATDRPLDPLFHITARSKDEQGQNQMKSEQNGDSLI